MKIAIGTLTIYGNSFSIFKSQCLQLLVITFCYMGIMGSVVLSQHLMCRFGCGHEELSLQLPLGKAMTYTETRKR